MCGIDAYIGPLFDKEPVSKVIRGLEILQYRGYDSAGIAVHNGDSIQVMKGAGQLEDVVKNLGLEKVKGRAVIGHTRWATHGGVNDTNAHPHYSCDGSVVVVHNGVIENYDDLVKELERGGHILKSQTDTEVIPHLVEVSYNSGLSLEKSVHSATKMLRGSYGIAVMGKRDPDKIVVASRDSPVVIGTTNGGGNFAASDVYAFAGEAEKAIFLENGDIGVITPDSVTIYDCGFNIVNRETKLLDSMGLTKSGKGGYKHHMEEEIVHQPKTILSTIRKIDQCSLDKVVEMVMNSNNVVGIGCGTSYNALLDLKMMSSKMIKKNIDVEYGSEAEELSVIGKDTTVIAVSQSGETADVIAPTRHAKKEGARVIAITNSRNSALGRQSDETLYLNCGPEFGVAATKTFTSQLAINVMLTNRMGGHEKSERAVRVGADLQYIPNKMEQVISRYKNNMSDIVDRVVKQNAVYFIGRRENRITALEGALKLKEVAYVHSEAFPSGELKHGPLAMITDGVVVMASLPNPGSSIYNDTVSNIREIKARGGYVVGLHDENDTKATSLFDKSIPMPSTNSYLLPFVHTPFYQLLAFKTAKSLGYNPDRPRNLAKSVTVK